MIGGRHPRAIASRVGSQVVRPSARERLSLRGKSRGEARPGLAIATAAEIALTAASLSFCALALAADTAPAAGRYAATLCVRTTARAPPSCGPADVDVRAGGLVRVQVSDIVYWLQLGAAQSVVVMTQGTMQLDEFDTVAQWRGRSLRFADEEKDVRYEVRVGVPTRR